MTNEFHCRVVTPDGVMFDEPIISAIVPVYDGLAGILINHSPLLSTIPGGMLALRTAHDTAFFLEVSNGFAEMRDNLLTILSDKTGELIRRDRLSAHQMLLDAQRELRDQQKQELADKADKAAAKASMI